MYDYPGNVRSSNIIECGVLLSQNDLIVLSSLPDKVRIQNSLGIENDVNSLVGLSLREIEKLVIEKHWKQIRETGKARQDAWNKRKRAQEQIKRIRAKRK